MMPLFGRSSWSTEGGPSADAQKLLDTLARHAPMAFARSQLAIFTWSSPKSSSYESAISELKRRGLVDDDGGAFQPSEEGIASSTVDPQSAVNLLDAWRSALPKQERTLLETLLTTYPKALSRGALASQSGYSATSSAFQAAISSLRRNGLIEADGADLRATSMLIDH